jgi:ABC-type transporter Mla subunit MlaD
MQHPPPPPTPPHTPTTPPQLQDKHSAVLAKRQREGLGDANRHLAQQLAALQEEQHQLGAALEDAAAANGVAAARLQAAEHNLQHSVCQTKVG